MSRRDYRDDGTVRMSADASVPNFKSVGRHSDVSSVGSTPMHLRHRGGKVLSILFRAILPNSRLLTDRWGIR
jgi:hypothetical protein